MYDFSIIIPSRNRPSSLKRLLDSIENKSNKNNPCSYEILIALDDDDLNDYSFIDKGIKIFRQPRGTMLNRDYINPLASKTTGEYIWFLGDDTEIETDDWNLVAQGWIIQHHTMTIPIGLNPPVIDLSVHGDWGKWKIWYGDTYDTTRNFNNVGNFAGFPIISRKAYEILGYMFHPDIAGWGSDKYLHYIFEKVGRIKNLQAIKIKHHHIIDDETSEGMKRAYEKSGSGSDMSFKEDIKILEDEISGELSAIIS